MPAKLFTGPEHLDFRGIPDSLSEKHHLEGSECCLIHADVARQTGGKHGGVYLNPAVRVGYNAPAYDQVHAEKGASWLSKWQIFGGIWRNRLARWLTFEAREWHVNSKIAKWSRELKSNREPGPYCVIN